MLKYFLGLQTKNKNAENNEKRLKDKEKAINFAAAGLMKRDLVEMRREYQFDEDIPIGNGAFGIVCKGTTVEGNFVAVKIQSVNTEVERYRVSMELLALAKLSGKSDSIVKFHECYVDVRTVYLVLEYVGGGTLGELFKTPYEGENTVFHLRTITERDIQHIARQCINALAVAKKEKICHKGVKIENILVTNWDTLHIVLIDFNVNRDLTYEKHYMGTNKGTSGFKAPETYKKKDKEQYSHKSDIWLAGAIIFSLFSWGIYPYNELNKYEFKGGYGTTLRELDEQTPLIFCDKQFDQASYGAKLFLRKMLQLNPKKRANYTKLQKDKWFAETKPQDEDAYNFNKKAQEE